MTSKKGTSPITKAAKKAVTKNIKVSQRIAAATADKNPVTPITKIFLRAGFVFAETAPLGDDMTTAHGYVRGTDAAVFIHHNTSTEIGASWIVTQNGVEVEGKTEEALVALLFPAAVEKHIVTAIELLGKVTQRTFQLSKLAGDDGYTDRMRLLKSIRQTDKVLAKDVTLNIVAKEFYKALGIKPGADQEPVFVTTCKAILNQDGRTKRLVDRTKQEHIKDVLRRTLGQRMILDGKPILPAAKKLTDRKQKAADSRMKNEVLAQITAKRKQEEYTPLAVPRPDAPLTVVLEDICILTDTNNGVSMLLLEKPNSQGGICAYNNGSRVAAGVVPTELLVSLRRDVSDDLVRDVNQLLHPLTNVPVSFVAERYLTAVLEHCKEKMIMANETAVKTKKFAPPANVKPNGKKEVAAAKAGKVGRAASTKEHSKKTSSEGSTRAKVEQNPDAIITLAKKPGEDDKLAKRDKVIVEILSENGKKMTLGALLKAMGKKIDTGGARTMESVWSWHGSPNQILLAGGFITVKS